MTTLSLHKLGKMLTSHNLDPVRYFAVSGSCTYIEVRARENADRFLLYIPSKYEVQVASSSNVFEVSYLEVDSDGNIAELYAGDPDDVELEKKYEEVELNDAERLMKEKDLEGSLEENYNRPVSLKDRSKTDRQKLHGIFRQLRRLKLCVQNLKYKLCICYKNYLCCVHRDDSLQGFTITGMSGVSQTQLLVTIDLETLYTKLPSVAIDIKTIREGVYSVLTKNQVKHSKNLQKLLQYKSELSVSADVIMEKKARYIRQLAQLEGLFDQLTMAEIHAGDRLKSIQERYNSEASVKGLHRDIEKTHQMAKHEETLVNSANLKKELSQMMDLVKMHLENLALSVDKICFDNTIMLDAILKNFVTLTDF